MKLPFLQHFLPNEHFFENQTKLEPDLFNSI